MTAPELGGMVLGPWTFAPAVVMPLVACAVAYALGVRRTRWSPWRSLSFIAGLAVIAVALLSGLDAYGDRLLSAHMLQHMLLLLGAPPLLLGGDPVGLLMRSVPPARRSALARGLRRARSVLRPAVCVAAFSVVLIGIHVPPFYDATLRHPPLHDAEHALLLAAGALLFWPLLDADPVSSRRLGGLGRLLYAVASMPAMALVGAYLNRHAAEVYAAYGPASRALGVAPLADQAKAGALMWVVGNVAMTVIGLTAAMAALEGEERRQVAVDARGGRR